MTHWDKYPHIWKTKAEFFTWLRGALRKAVWEYYPVKLDFKTKNCFSPPTGYTGKGKKGNYCALTGEWTMTSNLEVDHIHGNMPLSEYEHILPFIEHLLAFKENMQLVSKEAHKIKSYAERMGITYEEATAEKKAIKIIKEKKDWRYLLEEGIEPSKNQAGRRKQIVENILNGGK